jgi:hypothetical protein
MDIKGPSDRQQLHAADVARSQEPARSGKPAETRHVRSDATHAVTEKQSGAQLEVLDLVAKLRKHPEVRAELVRQVAEKLSSGYYLTRQAAERTAASLLAD